MSDGRYQRGMYDDLDPRRQEEVEKAENVQRAREGAMRMQSEVDLAFLVGNPHFRRWFWTVLEKGGIYRAAFLAHDGAAQYENGRRALALQLLDEALGVEPKFRIDLSVEQAKLEESLREQSNPKRS